MIMIDVDRFKSFNDTRGHEAGDMVLRRLALVLQINTRLEDIPCRYGGEEFLLFVSGVTAESLISRANQIREAVSDMEVRFQGELLSDVTVSCGVAVFPDHGRTCG